MSGCVFLEVCGDFVHMFYAVFVFVGVWAFVCQSRVHANGREGGVRASRAQCDGGGERQQPSHQAKWACEQKKDQKGGRGLEGKGTASDTAPRRHVPCRAGSLALYAPPQVALWRAYSVNL